MITRSQRKKRKLSQDFGDGMSPLSGHALKLVVECLEPPDVLNCVQTCQQWNRDIDEEAWSAVAKMKFPEAVLAIEAAEAKHNFKLPYRSMALGLSRQCHPDCKYEEEVRSFPKSRLRLEDILAIVEVRDNSTNKYLGAWTSLLTRNYDSSGRVCFQFLFDDDSMNDVKLSATSDEIVREDDFGQTFFPAENVPWNVFDKLELKSRLMRLDSGNNVYGKCVCLNNHIKHCMSFDGNTETRFYYSDLKPTAKNESGFIARKLCVKKEYNNIWCDVDVEMEPAIETYNQSQRDWIEQMEGAARAIEENGRLEEPDEDFSVEVPELNESDDRNKEFFYKCSSIRFTFRAFRERHWNPEGYEWSKHAYMESTDDLLLILEGLDWK